MYSTDAILRYSIDYVLDSDKYDVLGKRRQQIRGQEHIPNGICAGRGFLFLSVQVLVLSSEQELVPIVTKIYFIKSAAE
jgi:hypothetical protein